MMIDRSTSATLDRIFDEMYNLISEANRIPLTDKIIIEESDLAGILDDLKEAIPKEVKSATDCLKNKKQSSPKLMKKLTILFCRLKPKLTVF